MRHAIWDDPLDGGDDAGPLVATAAPAHDAAAAWRAAEDAAWRPLLVAAEAPARLDERLLGWPADATPAAPSGSTAPRLVEALTGAVAVGMGDLAQRSAASPTAVCRNLAILADRGVAREISGQARYQVWTANV